MNDLALLEEMPQSLSWPLRRSFVEYASTVRDFCIYTDGDAEVRVRSFEVFHWPAAAAAEQTKSKVWMFSGGIDLQGYGGMMNVSLHRPEIQWVSDSVYLTVVPRISVGSVESGETAEGVRSVFAELHSPVHDSTAQAVLWQVAVSEYGADALGGVYPVGTPLDPLTVQLRSD